jgi:fused signal recognition particle receptor
MFESLKKKLSSWLGGGKKEEEKKPKKKEKKGKKESKKEKKSKAKAEKAEIIKKLKKSVEKEVKEEKKAEKVEETKGEEPAEEIIEETEEEQPPAETKTPAEPPAPQETEEVKEEKTAEKKGFFAKIKDKFKTKGEKKEEAEVEKIIEEAVQETPEPEVKEEEKGNFFSKLFSKLSSVKINEENFNEIFSELEIILLENNVAIEVVEKIRESLKKSLIDLEVKRTDIGKKILGALKEAILEVLIEPPNLLKEIEKKKDEPYVILFFGINGSGKTTSIAKLAHNLKKAGVSVVMAAGDTFRAASIEQLKTHGEKLGIDVISSEYGSDPASVAFSAIQHAKKNHTKVVLIDTAGRMYTKQNLMKEMEKIVRVSKPDLKIFVGESITGNDATEQAKTFNETAGIDGIILSKADVDDKAGTILSVSYVTKRPIYFLGVGQNYDDLKDFKKSDVLKNLGL